MIDLTPLDVRNKRGDFKRLMRGYDPQEVDIFLELVAERLEGLVRENLQLKDRTATLQQPGQLVGSPVQFAITEPALIVANGDRTGLRP